MDQTQIDVLFALFAAIEKAVDANTGDNDPPQYLFEILRLVKAGESVLSGLPIKGE